MKVALRKNKGILEFLGFVDGKGNIRKAKMRRVNPGKKVRVWEVVSPKGAVVKVSKSKAVAQKHLKAIRSEVTRYSPGYFIRESSYFG
jgi:hypothetical protein